MNQTEKQNYRNELIEDSLLKEELTLHKQVDEALKNELAIEDFKGRLSKIHENVSSPQDRPIRKLTGKWYWAAASAALITSAGVFSYTNSSSPDKLYDKYYQTWNSGIVTRGVVTDKEVNTIVGLFEEGKYTESLEALNSLETEKQGDPKLMLLKGCTLMELNKTEEAIKEFQKFDTREYTFYTDAANWYEALCHLKLSEIDTAKDQLNTIALANGSYAEEAKKILKKLD